MVPAKDTTIAGAPASWSSRPGSGWFWGSRNTVDADGTAYGPGLRRDGRAADVPPGPGALLGQWGRVCVGRVFSVLLGRGRRIGRLALSGYVVILPAVLYFRGGPPSVQLPWREVLLSPAGAAGLLAVLATVLMWLPPANAYFARADAHERETPAGSEPRTARVPPEVTAAAWILVGSGVIAALEAVLGLLLLWGTSGSGANTTPALVLYLTLASVAVANFACASAVRRGKLFVRPFVTAVPVAGLVLVVVAAVAASSSAPAGSPAVAGGPTSAILLAVLSQGLPLIGGLVAAAGFRNSEDRRRCGVPRRVRTPRRGPGTSGR